MTCCKRRNQRVERPEQEQGGLGKQVADARLNARRRRAVAWLGARRTARSRGQSAILHAEGRHTGGTAHEHSSNPSRGLDAVAGRGQCPRRRVPGRPGGGGCRDRDDGSVPTGGHGAGGARRPHRGRRQRCRDCRVRGARHAPARGRWAPGGAGIHRGARALHVARRVARHARLAWCTALGGHRRAGQGGGRPSRAGHVDRRPRLAPGEMARPAGRCGRRCADQRGAERCSTASSRGARARERARRHRQCGGVGTGRHRCRVSRSLGRPDRAGCQRHADRVAGRYGGRARVRGAAAGAGCAARGRATTVAGRTGSSGRAGSAQQGRHHVPRCGCFVRDDRSVSRAGGERRVADPDVRDGGWRERRAPGHGTAALPAGRARESFPDGAGDQALGGWRAGFAQCVAARAVHGRARQHRARARQPGDDRAHGGASRSRTATS